MDCSKQQSTCIECTRKCLEKHGRSSSSSSPSSIPASFFKIMIGDNYDKILFIPPMFARTLRVLIKESIYLEDSTERIWEVKLSKIDGSLAFESGWHDFVQAHFISVGEVLTFRRITVTYFYVEIYGKTSISCERPFDGIKDCDNRKRKRNGKSLSPGSYPHHAKDSGRTQIPLRRNSPKSLHMHIGAATKSEEASRSSPIVITDDESDNEVMETRVTSFPYGDKSKEYEASVEEYGKGRKENLGLTDRSVSNYFLCKVRRSCMEDKHLVCEQEVINVPPIDSVNLETFQRESNSQNTNSLLVNEGKLSDCHANLRSTETVTIEGCTNSETSTEFAAMWAIFEHSVNEERVSTVGCSNGHDIADEDWTKNQRVNNADESEQEDVFSKMDDDQVIGNSNERPQIAMLSFVKDVEVCGKCDVVNDGIHYSADDLEPEHEVDKDASTDNCVLEKDGEDEVDLTRKDSSVHENILETSSDAPILNCTKDGEGSSTPAKENVENLQPIIKEEGTSQVGIAGSPSSVIVDVPGSDEVRIALEESSYQPENPQPIIKEEGTSQDVIAGSPSSVIVDAPGSDEVGIVLEESSYQPGTVAGEFQEVDDNMVTPCSKIVPGIITTEIEDLVDLPPPSYPSFRITVSVISQSWLLLPEILPARFLKKRHERRVAVLCDPSMALWPVLYHESLSFRGFIAGWEEFAKSNDLRQGDTCEIEAATESEQPVFLVRISKAPNPM